MSANNYQPNGLVIGIALLTMAALFLAIVVYIVAGIAAAILTVLCVCSLWKPLKLGKHTITPKEARWFIGRGIIGAYALPFIALIVAQMLKKEIESDWQIHIMAIGYILGSLGGEWVISKLKEVLAEEEEVVSPPEAQQSLQQRVTQNPKPFDYATWDDESEVDPYK